MSLTPEQALSRLAALCSRGEQAESDLRGKLAAWGVVPSQADVIISRLQAEGFLDEQRYAIAFVRDKFRFNKWGRIKIAHALRQKAVSAAAIDTALDEIDEIDYRRTLLQLLQAKARTVGGSDHWARRAALLRFAASRGFEHDLCYGCVDQVLNTAIDDEQD